MDYGGNVLRHGPVDAIRIDEPATDGNGEAPAKECPECQALIHAAYQLCPECGYEFPPPERAKHDAKASTASILSGEVTTIDYPVADISYSVHTKRDTEPGHPKTMRVEYLIGWHHYQSEWVCFEHTGYARHKAEAWWRRRSDVPVPDSAEDAVYFAEQGALASAKSITVRCVSGEEFDRIIGYELGEKPVYREPGWDDVEPAGESEPVFGGADDADEVPF